MLSYLSSCFNFFITIFDFTHKLSTKLLVLYLYMPRHHQISVEKAAVMVHTLFNFIDIRDRSEAHIATSIPFLELLSVNYGMKKIENE